MATKTASDEGETLSSIYQYLKMNRPIIGDLTLFN